MMRKRTLFALLLALFVLAGCTGGDVSLVQDGTMNGYESTTIGKAFEASFDSPKWEAFETDKGQRVVEFTGKVTKAMHDRCRQEILDAYEQPQTQPYMVHSARTMLGEENFEKLISSYADQGYDNPERAAVAHAHEGWNVWKVGTPVRFQWTVNTDGKTFRLTYLESEAWKTGNNTALDLKDILNYIYS